MGDAEGCCAACMEMGGNTAYLDSDGLLYCLLKVAFIAPKACPHRPEGLP